MRKKKKHIISAILVLCLLFICSACGKQEKKQEETKKETKAVETASLEGTLVSFSGTDLMIEAEEQEYEFDISEATVNTVNMLCLLYTSKLRVENNLAGVIIDRFGKDVMMIPEDENHFTVNVDVRVSNQFLGWVFYLGEGVKIVSPEEVLERMNREITR